jgi:hypothetical protein
MDRSANHGSGFTRKMNDPSLAGYTMSKMRKFLKDNGLKDEGTRKDLCKRITDNGLLNIPSVFELNKPIGSANDTCYAGYPKYPLSGTSNVDEYEVTCGLHMNRYYRISSLLCATISSRSLEDVMKGDQCGPISHKMAKNIIRVAAKRIFSDPYRSFVEPVTNSYDSYMEMEGKQHVGKFGMGFFSLLYWLNNPTAFLTINSRYAIPETGYICEWKAHIIWVEEDDEYHFILSESSISNVEDNSLTGTVITIDNISMENGGIDESKLFRVLFTSFGEVRHVNINMRSFGIYPVAVNEGGPLIEVVLNRHKSVDTGNDVEIIIFRDNALGMSLDTLLGKLLLPTISTKTLENFSNKDVDDKAPNRIIIDDIKFRRTPRLNIVGKNRDSLLITVGDIGIYSAEVSTRHKSMYMENKQVEKLKNKGVKKYIISLPFNSPMPVSRDDVILEDEGFYNVMKTQIYDIIDMLVKNAEQVDVFMNLLITYVEYSGNKNAYYLIADAQEYLRKYPNVYTIPKGTIDIFNLVSKDIESHPIFIEGDIIDTERIVEMLKRNTDVMEDVFRFLMIVPVNNLSTIGDISTDGNILGVLFVDKEILGGPDWKEEVIQSSFLILKEHIDGEYSGGSMFSDLIDTMKASGDISPYAFPVEYWITPFFRQWVGIAGHGYQTEMSSILYNTLIGVSKRNSSELMSFMSTRFDKTKIGKSGYSGTNPFGDYKGGLIDEVYIKYILSATIIYFDSIRLTTDAVVMIRNPMVDTFLNMYEKKDMKYLNDVLHIMASEHPVHYYYIDTLLNNNKDRIPIASTPLVVKYLQEELKTRYTISTLVDIIQELANNIQNKEYNFVVTNLQLSLNIYLSIIIERDYIIENLCTIT